MMCLFKSKVSHKHTVITVMSLPMIHDDDDANL